MYKFFIIYIFLLKYFYYTETEVSQFSDMETWIVILTSIKTTVLSFIDRLRSIQKYQK